MVSVLCEQLHGSCENTFSHGAAFLLCLFFQFFLCHAAILAEIWQHEHPLRQTTIRRYEFYAVAQPSRPLYQWRVPQL